MKDKNGQFQLLHNCSFEQDIYDTSMEHDGISTKPYPKKLIAYIRGDYDYKWWTGFFCIHNDMRTPETDGEGDALLKYLITEKVTNLHSLQEYCKSFDNGREDCWLYIEGVLCNYALRLIPIEKNYNLYLYQYIRGESV